MTQPYGNLAVMADERIQQQIKISQNADVSIEAMRKTVGMTKVELLSRVCQWFATQRPLIQKLVLGLVDDELKPAARQALVKQLTQQVAGKKSAQDSAVDDQIDEMTGGKPKTNRGAA